MTCPRSDACVFHQVVAPSIIQRVRYASVYSYCRGGQHEECALHEALAAGESVTRNLLPDGSIGDYLEHGDTCSIRRFLIIEETPIFAALTASTITNHFAGAQIVRKTSFEDALHELSREYHAIVCGYGLGGGRTAHDIRKHTDAPMVILTGRPDEIDLPARSRRVGKSEGPEALASAIRACLA
jgi:hypothetical protein